MIINLPKQPDGNQFEEAMASAVRAIGYFIETRTILDHEGREVLELDVVASPATDQFQAKVLLDAKKSTAGFGDIFKIFGWRVFLKIPKGCVVCGGESETRDVTAFNKICPNLEVYVEHFDITKEIALPVLPVLNKGADEKLRSLARLVGWYGLIAERLCNKDYQEQKKANPSEDIFTRVHQYRRACHLAFFESKPLKRVELLFDAFKSNPHITGACLDWQAVKSGKERTAVLNAVLDSSEFSWIQHVLALETKARILIIKNGLEAAMLDAEKDAEMKDFWEAFELAMLPDSFQQGFSRLSQFQHKHAVPYVLQLYTELFGGFLIDDADQSHLASLAGVPVEVVRESLEIFEVFFPYEKGWYQQSKDLRMMKMIPAYLRGIGAFYRRFLNSPKSYMDIAPKMGWLMGKWHNAVLSILGRELAKKETE